MISSLLNVFNQTDEVLKLRGPPQKCEKADCTDKHLEMEPLPRLSLSEAYTFVYGKDTPIFNAIFASYCL